MKQLGRVGGLCLGAVWLFWGTEVRAQNNAPPGKRAYQDFAMRNEGNAARGRELFQNDAKGSCAKCHAVDGRTALAGPDLSSIGDKFPRRELIRSVLEPSATIAVGYGLTIVETRDGEEVSGVVKQVTDQAIDLIGADGKHVLVPLGSVRQQSVSDLSLMPEGLEAALTLAEFGDLIAYLESLKFPTNAVASTRGTPAVIPPSAAPVRFEPWLGANIRLEHPVWFGGVPGPGRRFVAVEHFGRAWLIEREPSGDSQTLLLDLSKVVRKSVPTGLLGLAFHPRFAENRKYFIKYHVEENGRIFTLLEERRFSPDGRTDSGQARELLRIAGVTQDHSGGCLEFGPDGYLYFGMGDTGPQGDPQGHGQSLNTLLGKILRLDVDREEAGRGYAVPKDNPFLGRPEVRPEIWAYGFREPWRFTFDRATGDLWVGDVGQDRFEEVSLVRAGENHGWNVFEGFNRFSDRHRQEGARYVPPILGYSHRLGVSVTGGYVYRGSQGARLRGWYVFADFETRRVWALTQTNRVLDRVVEIGRAPSRVSSFSQDADGELFLVGYDDGRIYRLDLAAVDPEPLELQVVVPTSENAPATWRYILATPAEGWTRSDFNDAAWTSAPGGFGTAGTPGAVVRTEWRSRDIWLRRELTLTEEQARSSSLALRLHHDEDAEVYLNGVAAAQLPRWTSGYVEVPIAAEARRALQPGRNVLAIHCRQNSGGQYIDAGLVRHVRRAAAR